MKNLRSNTNRALRAPRHESRVETPRKRPRQSEASDGADNFLPDPGELSRLLGMRKSSSVEEILRSALLNPVTEVSGNRGKRIRGQLVVLGYSLFSNSSRLSLTAAKQCRVCAEVVEFIHAGSLVVDDIEDGSEVRRGRPALHVRYGIPIALNAGNWLYFWPFELIKALELPKETLLCAYERYHRTLLRAHFGQAIDLGARVDALLPQQIVDICRASLELKTGALMGFAAALGALLGGASDPGISILDGFGRDLGIALQMFDDLGNLIGNCEPFKKYEDLLLFRPSWVWACAAKNSSPTDFQQFVSAVRKLPVADDLEGWIERHRVVDLCRKGARDHLNATFQTLEQRLNAEKIEWSRRTYEALRHLGEEIAVAYD